MARCPVYPVRAQRYKVVRLNGFYDFAGLEAFNADADPLRGAVYDSPDGLQVRQKSARGYAGYLLADTAFFLG